MGLPTLLSRVKGPTRERLILNQWQAFAEDNLMLQIFHGPPMKAQNRSRRPVFKSETHENHDAKKMLSFVRGKPALPKVVFFCFCSCCLEPPIVEAHRRTQKRAVWHWASYRGSAEAQGCKNPFCIFLYVFLHFGPPPCGTPHEGPKSFQEARFQMRNT